VQEVQTNKSAQVHNYLVSGVKSATTNSWIEWLCVYFTV